MQKIKVAKGRSIENKLTPEITEFLRNKPEQRIIAKKVNTWLKEICNRNVCGGTAVGKYYGTLILDINYQGGEISISEDGVINLLGEEIKNKKEFVQIFNKSFEII